MKIGTEPDMDPKRVQSAREAIGQRDGTFRSTPKRRVYGHSSSPAGVIGFAEYECDGLKSRSAPTILPGFDEVRARAPIGMDIAAGSTATLPGIFNECWMRKRLRSCKQTRRAAAVSPDFLDVASLCWANKSRSHQHCGTEHASARLLCRAASHSHGILSRPCAHRADVLRGLLRTEARLR